MFKLSSLLRAGLVGATLAVATPMSGTVSSAHAQQAEATRVGVVDIAAVERQSKVWQDLKAKIDGQNAELKSLLEVPQGELRERQKELPDQRLLLSEEAFRAEQQKLANDMRAFATRGTNLKRQVEKNLASGRGQIRRTLTQILANISQERGIALVLNASAPNSTVLFFASVLSLNEEALKRLDQEMTVVEVPALVKE